MTVRIRHARPADLDPLQAIEDEADELLVERLRPDRWEPAPSGASRAAEQEPATPFHRGLVETERRLGLDRYGRRVQMAADLR